MLVTHWSYELVVRAIGDLCRRTQGADRDEIAASLARYGRWEFADYAES